MKDCGYALRKAYYDKLTSASYSLGVYDTIFWYFCGSLKQTYHRNEIGRAHV